jgi:hypothetical protein
MMKRLTVASHIPKDNDIDADAGEAEVSGVMIPVTVLVFFVAGEWDVSAAWEASRLLFLLFSDDIIML